VTLAGLVAVFWAQFAWVRPTNFGGYDEWLLISLVSKGVVAFPYANRPFVLLWTLPAAWLWPHDLRSFLVMESVYLCFSAVLLVALVGRLAPRLAGIAFLAGVVSITWAPVDALRLDTVLINGYSGFTFATLLAILLLVESWRRDRPVLLALGGLLALVTARGFEGVVPLLAAAPALLMAWRPARSRRLLVWLLAWEAVVLLAAALAVMPFAGRAGAGSYQGSALGGLDLHPARVAARMGRLYAYHLVPLVSPSLEELARPGAFVAGLVFLAAFAIAMRSVTPPGPGARRPLVWLAGCGVALAGLAYAPFTLSPAVLLTRRTQMLSAPGIGLALAACAGLLATMAGSRWRKPLLAAAGFWVVTVGTARTIALQGEWDGWRSVYPAQHRTLVQLTDQAPDLEPNTLVVLIDDGPRKAWPATFTFRHAVDYLYEGRALGLVWRGEDFLYPAAFGPQGVYCSPWPVIRQAWRVQPTFHGYDEIVVARRGTDGALRLLAGWPADVLPALPPGARYDPAARVRAGTALPPSRRILRTVAPGGVAGVVSSAAMPASLLDGTATARAIKEELRAPIASLAERGVRPGLGVVLAGDDPASAVYVRNKTRACEDLGIHHETALLPASTTTEEVLAVVEGYNRRADIHGILVQLPLPRAVDADRVLLRVRPEKDVDGFHPENVGRLVQKRPRFVPCTPSGIMELLVRNRVEVSGRRAVVVGRSDIVGKPMALLLLHADATVTICHSRTRDLPSVTREADILVAAMGKAGFIRGEHVRPGAVVVDVGINRIDREDEARDLLDEGRRADFARKGYALVGDVHAPSVREVASALTPVPGGVGPLTIAMLMSNTVRAARQA